MGRYMSGSNVENQYQTEQQHQLSSMEEEIIMVCGCMGWNGVGKLVEFRER